jgi:hypothetical protein
MGHLGSNQELRVLSRTVLSRTMAISRQPAGAKDRTRDVIPPLRPPRDLPLSGRRIHALLPHGAGRRAQVSEFSFTS